MKTHPVVLISGDGIGPEVTAAKARILGGDLGTEAFADAVIGRMKHAAT